MKSCGKQKWTFGNIASETNEKENAQLIAIDHQKAKIAWRLFAFDSLKCFTVLLHNPLSNQ